VIDGKSVIKTNFLNNLRVEYYKIDFKAEIEFEKDEFRNGVERLPGDRAKYWGTIAIVRENMGNNWSIGPINNLHILSASRAPVFSSIKETESTAEQNGCINNLRQIDAAISDWALETGKTNGALPTENEIKPFVKVNANNEIPTCPAGGIYTLHPVGSNPQVTCSIPGHVLP
jgi:hypothetical protein